nr:DUF499 domain-containing protein [Candidatus Sigynarchaeota archaeon]
MSQKLLPQVWNVNKPYKDVTDGVISEDVFAASLGKVYSNRAESIYQDPVEFFEKTYITETIGLLIKDVAEKLNGKHPEFAPIYKLQTSFGGGKTHNLIALYHAFKNKPTTSKVFTQLINGVSLPSSVKVVCLDGEEFNPVEGDKREEGVEIHTFWGEMAYQISGKGGYERLRRNDELMTSPGSKTLESLMDSDPILILLDEAAPYYSRADAVVVGGTTLTKQTNTFLADLLSAVSKKTNAVVVLTLASSQDAFHEYTAEINNALQQAESIVARRAREMPVTKENEIYGVIRRRLFEKWDEDAAKKVAAEYYSMYASIAELNNKYKTKEYQDRLVRSYPFHPELIDILVERVASISGFQRTRGALRILARVVADVWQKNEKDAHIILPAFVALDNPLIKKELTGRIKKDDLVPAIIADIANDNNDAKSQVWNKEYLDKKLPPLASRLSNAVYLYSLIIGRDKLGMDDFTILGSVLTPGVNPSTYLTLLKRMDDSFWYMRQAAGRYFFFSEPTINKIIQDYMSLVEANKIRMRIRAEIEKSFKGDIFDLKVQPAGPSDVPDEEKLKLIVIDYKTTFVDSKEDPMPNIVEQIWNYGRDNRPRVFKNTTYFVVADKNHVPRMEDIAREYEAYQIMDERKDDIINLSEEQREKLESKKKTIEQDLKIAVSNVYRFLYYPKGTTIESAELDPAAIGESRKTRQEIIKELLKAEGKIKDSITAAYAKGKAWPSHQVEVTTEEFKNWFYQKFSLPIPAKLDTIKETIKDGVNTKVWVYQSQSKTYLSGDKISTVKIGAEDKLIVLDEAKKRNLCNEEGVRCAKCDQWPCACKPEGDDTEGGTIIDGGPGPITGDGGKRPKPPKPRSDKEKKPTRFSYHSPKGLPEIIIKNFADECEEKKPTSIQELQITCDSTVAVRAIITLFVHFPENKQVDVSFNVQRTEETPDSIKKANLEYAGAPDDFREFYNGIASFIDAKKLKPQVTVTLDFDDKPKEHLDVFFSKLKNYNSVEFEIGIEGQILQKM